MPNRNTRSVNAATGARAVLVEAELAVRVVLDDEEPVAIGEPGKVTPPFERQHRAGRVLEVGHGVDELRSEAGGEWPASSSVRSPSVSAATPTSSGSHAAQGLDRAEVPGLLDHHDIARVEHRSGHQIERLLRPGGDEHTVGGGTDPLPHGGSQ